MNERSIFLAAAEITDPAERAAYLEKACAGNPALRRGVEELLAANAKSGTFMPAPAAGMTTDQAPGEGPGSRVGPYKLLQQIGEGGMGAVFMAEQEVPVRRTVALKIIREGMDSRAVLARFEAERQALALMDHPNIAKVLDAGATSSGRPYFVMELVKGVPITKFCDEHQLPLRERLELFVPVCQAIQHAHQKGIIHRDIKPSNVLVALYDDRPVPKVIDFGVAKAASQKLTDKTLFTAFGAVVGTLEYMSPEQARLNQLDIDTRSDVYALGVLLYELLTGTTPIERSRLKSAALDEVLRLIREEEPERPSTRLSTTQARPAVAARRGEPGRLGKVVRGELDWIVMKALEKDRTRRYETANGLARDVERYLKDEAVEACPPTLGYRLRKAYRKNRAAVTVAAAFVLLLAFSAVVSAALAVQARRAEHDARIERNRAAQREIEATEQRDRAEREQKRAEEEKKAAEAVRNFLQDDLLRQASLFDQAESLRLSGATDIAVTPNPTVYDLVNRAAAQLTPERLEARFPNMPFVQAEVLRTVAVTYLGINQQATKALALLIRAVDLYLESRGPDDRATLNARHSLALAHCQTGQLGEGKKQLELVRDDKVRLLGPHDRDTFLTQMSLGMIDLSTNRFADVIAHFQSQRDAARTHLGPDDIVTLQFNALLAIGYRYVGRHEEAIRELEGNRATLRRLKVRFDHPGARANAQELDLSYKAAGRIQDSIPLLQEMLGDIEKSNGVAHADTWYPRHQLAWRYVESNSAEQAISLFEKNLAAAGNPVREAATREALIRTYKRLGRAREAETQFQKLLDSHGKQNGSDHRSWAMGALRYQVGMALLEDDRIAEAEQLLVAAYEEMTATIAERPAAEKFHPTSMAGTLTDVNKALGRPDEVKKWAARRIPGGEQRVDLLRKQLPQNPETFLVVSRGLCWAYTDAGRHAEAIKLFEEALAVFKTLDKSVDPLTLPLVSYRRAAVQAGRPDLAIEMTNIILAHVRQRPNPSQLAFAGELLELGHYLYVANRFAEAVTQLRESLRIQTEVAGPNWSRTKTKYWLASAFLRQKNFAEAEPMLLEAHKESKEQIRQAPLWEKQYPVMAAERLIQMYTTLGKFDEAAKWKKELASRDRMPKWW